MNTESIINDLKDPSIQKKEEVISFIGDLLESYATIDAFSDFIEQLAKYAVNEDNEEIKIGLLDVILKASEHRKMDGINFKIIEDNLDFLSIECLEKAIEILAFSHNIKYFNTIQKYTLHENTKIAYVATIAIEEIQGV